MMQPAEFLEKYVDFAGGASERNGPQLSILAPPHLSEVGAHEFWVADEEPPNRELSLLYLGHPFLEQVLDAARKDGVVACRHAPPPPSRRTDLLQRLSRQITFRNATITPGNPIARVTPWLLFTFGVTYIWDDKRQEIRRVGVDAFHGCSFDPAVLSRCWLEEGPLTREIDLGSGYQAAQKLLERRIEPRVQALQRDSSRYLEVESSRLERYYEQLLQDLRKREKSGDKVKRTEAERDARRRDLEDRFRLRVQARVIQLERIDLYRDHLPLTVSRRKVTRSLQLTYNYLLKEFDPCPCDACQSRVNLVWLCEQGHILCSGCYQECIHCKSSRCAACLGSPVQARCPSCVESKAPSHSAPLAPKARPEASQSAPAKPRATEPVPPKAGPVRSAAKDLILLACSNLPYRNLPELLKPIDEALDRGNRYRAVQMLAELLHGLDPEHRDLITRLREVLKCLKLPSLEKARAALLDLRPVTKPKAQVRPVTKAPPAPEPSKNPIFWCLELNLSKRTDPQSLLLFKTYCEACWPAVHETYPQVEVRVWAACIVYAFSRLTQASVCELFDVPVSKVSNYWRIVHELVTNPRSR